MRGPSRLQIYLDLIEAVSRNRNLITIGKRVSLSPSDAENHLSFLVQEGFIRIVKQKDNRAKYELTTKGFEALKAIRKIARRERPLLKHGLAREEGVRDSGYK